MSPWQRTVTHRVSDHKPESSTLSIDIHLRYSLMMSTEKIYENSNICPKLTRLAAREEIWLS